MKSDDAFSFVRYKLVNALECINSTHVRNELKIAVHTRYSLPSLKSTKIVLVNLKTFQKYFSQKF